MVVDGDWDLFGWLEGFEEVIDAGAYRDGAENES